MCPYKLTPIVFVFGKKMDTNQNSNIHGPFLTIHFLGVHTGSGLDQHTICVLCSVYTAKNRSDDQGLSTSRKKTDQENKSDSISFHLITMIFTYVFGQGFSSFGSVSTNITVEKYTSDMI